MLAKPTVEDQLARTVVELRKENEDLKVSVAFLCGLLKDEILNGNMIVCGIARKHLGIELRKEDGTTVSTDGETERGTEESDQAVPG